MPERQRQRLLTAEALVRLCFARALVAWVPLPRWHGSLGHAGTDAVPETGVDPQWLAGRVERAAQRLPFEAKCLPQAMALSWMLRQRGLPHRVVIAARPREARGQDDALHAWVEVGEAVVLGDLPGPWHVIHAMGGPSPDPAA